MKNDSHQSIEQLREALILDAETGTLTWRKTGRKGHAGKVAGRISAKGYRDVSIAGKRLYAHRVVFALTHGRWPEGLVDHIDGNRLNNRPANLREVSNQANLQNSLSPCGKTSSGLRGVSLIKSSGKWKAYIVVDRRMKTLGHFDTREAAYAAYLEAKTRLHPGWAVLDPFDIAARLYAQYQEQPK